MFTEAAGRRPRDYQARPERTGAEACHGSTRYALIFAAISSIPAAEIIDSSAILPASSFTGDKITMPP